MLSMNTGNDYGGDLCKSHSARSEKEFCRACPSHLNKKELENVYFTLLENNLDLKTTINSQREKIKILSTKVQRLTTLQKTYLGKEPKECCGSKAVINEQKQCILELRRANQCLSERVRQLNMRLCSAKQFLKRSPFQSTSRCNRCSNKNVSMSALITKRSEINLRTAAASAQCLVKGTVSSRTADNVVVLQEKAVQYDFCDENKCRSHIEELKERNVDLQEELVRTKESHANVISQLQQDVCDLRAENLRVRSDRTFAEDRSEQLRTQLAEALMKLGSADLRCDELNVELAVEKRKVSELETRLKAADMSRRIAHAIETHLASIKMAKDQTKVLRDVGAGDHDEPVMNVNNKLLAVQSPLYRPKPAARTKIPHSIQTEDVPNKSSDDSGYTELNKSREDDTKASTYINQVLLEKIADLQNQVNSLKSFKNDYGVPGESCGVSRGLNPKPAEMFTTLPDKQSDENIISESSDSVVTEKRAGTNIVTHKTESDEHDNIESTSQAVDTGSKPGLIHTDSEQNKSDKQWSDIKSDTKLKESFKRFNKRGKDRGREMSTLIDSRKLSLQGSGDFTCEKNLIKTGSLDENTIININSADKDRRNFEKRNINIKNSNKNETSNSNSDIAANTEELNFLDKNISHTSKERVQESDKESHVGNKIIVEIPEKIITHCTSGEKRRNSDSSKGTYSIHKDKNLSKLSTKPKDNLDENGKNERNNHTATFQTRRTTLAAEVKKVLKITTTKDKLAPQRRSAASEPRTYVKAPRDASPDSTECEISSLSDLPSERDERSGYSRSPGEERPPTPTTTVTTTDYGSLSEGELPYLRDGTTLSDGERRLSNGTRKSRSVPMSSARQMEAALQEAGQELARCTRLLASRAHRSLDEPGLL